MEEMPIPQPPLQPRVSLISTGRRKRITALRLDPAIPGQEELA